MLFSSPARQHLPLLLACLPARLPARPQVEPDWPTLPQMSIEELYQGLRTRNWTSTHYSPSAPPWRIQLFTCAYL